VRLLITSIGVGLLLFFLWSLRDQQISAAPLLPINFGHLDHNEVNCVQCHHNYADDTGMTFCIDCHKKEPEIAPHIEEMFHDFCRDCHVEKHTLGEEGGPTRACFSCHEGDDLP